MDFLELESEFAGVKAGSGLRLEVFVMFINEDDESEISSDSSEDEKEDQEGLRRKTNPLIAACLADAVLGVHQLDERRFRNPVRKTVHGGRAGCRSLTKCGLDIENYEKLASGGNIARAEERFCLRCFGKAPDLVLPEPEEVEFSLRKSSQSSGSPAKQPWRAAAELSGEFQSPTLEPSDGEEFSFSDHECG